MEIQINYHEVKDFIYLRSVLKEIVNWTLNKLNLSVKSMQIILTSDNYLKKLHAEYFKLNSKTDVITFNLTDNPDQIEGEIYISIERAIEQSNQYKVTTPLEICRLLIHGCLHLAGFDDKNETQRKKMKIKENEFIKDISVLFSKQLQVGDT
jgi:rRNA maturation RNase YbeY